MRIRVATRGSKLSLIQTELVLREIKRVAPWVEFDIVTIRTTGDVVQDKPLYAIGVKGVFEKEVNLALLRGEADIAVHSLKDLPGAISEGLTIAMYSKRDPPFDAIISVNGYTLDTLPSGAVVGTSSVRRKAFLLAYRRDIRVEVLRGNVDTRVSKVLNGMYDAALIAEAGILRLYGDNPPIKIVRVDPRIIPPEPGQGIVAVVAREDDRDLVKLLQRASDPAATIEAETERLFVKAVGAGCHTPIGAVAMYRGGTIEMIVGVAHPDGAWRRIAVVHGREPSEVARKAAELARNWIVHGGEPGKTS